MARVLVAEDNTIQRLDPQESLEVAGHVVVAPETATEIRAALQDVVFDLVITDLSMPAITGWEIRDWLKVHRPHTPVIAVSGFLMSLPRGELTGFAMVLTKPLREARLIEAVRAAVAQEPTGRDGQMTSSPEK